MPREAIEHFLRFTTLALCVFGWSAVASAQANQDPAALYADQEYEQALKAADVRLAHKGATRAQTVDALRIKASALAVLGRDEDAGATFERLLDLAPRFQLPRSASPRIRGVFGAARARWQVKREGQLAMRLGASLAALSLEVAHPLSGRGGRAYRVRVTLADPKQIAKEVVLFYRRVGSQRFSTATIPAQSGTHAISIPGAVTASQRAYQLELYVQVVHDTGITLRRHGEPTQPLRVSIGAGRVPRPTPIVKRWWFWAGIAAVVVATPFVVDQMIDVGPQPVVGTIR